MKNTKTQKVVLCAMFSALTCILGPLSVPMVGLVPISLATLAVLLAGGMLGAKWGAMSQVIYILIGAIGLPVFSGFGSGLGKIVGPTGGYLLGYIAMAWLTGFLYTRLAKGRTGKAARTGILAGAMAVGTVALYLFGTIWFMAVTHTDLAAALMSCVVPFLLGDVAKIAVASVVTVQLDLRSVRTFGKAAGQTNAK